MPVVETPTVINSQDTVSASLGTDGKQKVNVCVLNLFGLALLGKEKDFPIGVGNGEDDFGHGVTQ